MANDQQRRKLFLWHMAGSYADKPVGLWPGGSTSTDNTV